MSLYLHVSMSPCRHVSMSPCLHVSMSSSIHFSKSHVFMSPCLHVSLFPRLDFSMFTCLNAHVSTENGTNGTVTSVCFLQTEDRNGQLPFICCKRKRKTDFVFLERQTINGNRQLLLIFYLLAEFYKIY
jgi:hypothetical protein